MPPIDFSGYLLKGQKFIFIYKSTTYKKTCRSSERGSFIDSVRGIILAYPV